MKQYCFLESPFGPTQELPVPNLQSTVILARQSIAQNLFASVALRSPSVYFQTVLAFCHLGVLLCRRCVSSIFDKSLSLPSLQQLPLLLLLRLILKFPAIFVSTSRCARCAVVYSPLQQQPHDQCTVLQNFRNIDWRMTTITRDTLEYGTCVG